MAFIGFQEDYEDYKKEHDKISQTIKEKEINVIPYESVKPISDEDLLILLNTRNRHDASEIYLQSDLSFYDVFYNNEELENDELLEEARSIRRIYKNIPDFEYAMYIRDLYLKRIVEKNGGPDRFRLLYQSNSITDWMPPTPILSSNAEGYYKYINGLDYSEVDEEAEERLDTLLHENRVPIEDLVVRGDVELRRNVLNTLDIILDSKESIRYGSTNSKINDVSVNDLYGLQQMFNSWYDDDKKESTKNIDRSHYFCDTEDARREQYFMQTPFDNEAGSLTRIIENPDAIDDIELEDPNEMVIDEKTNLPMTRAELKKRKIIRLMGESGWDTVKLMRNMSVGSNYELKLLSKKNARKKKAKKKAQSIMADIAGTEAISSLSSLEELEKALFD